MGLWQRLTGRSNSTVQGALPPPSSRGKSEIIVVDDPDGPGQVVLKDVDSGRLHPFPPVEMLLRGKDDLESYLAESGVAPGSDEYPMTENLLPDLVKHWAIDTGDMFGLLTPKVLNDYGLTVGEAEVGALSRLMLHAKSVQIAQDDRMWAVRHPTAPDLMASLIFMSDIWLSPDRIDGPLAFAIPTRSEVRVCAANDIKACAQASVWSSREFHWAGVEPAHKGRPLLSGLVTVGEGFTLQRLGGF